MENPFESHGLKPMLIGKASDPYDDPESIFELKLDGGRCLAYLDKETQLISRRGVKLHPFLPELEQMHRQVKGRCILDGELITGIGGKEDFGRVMSRLRQRSRSGIEMGMGRHPVTFVAFDLLYWEDEMTIQLPLMERKAQLQNAVAEGERFALSRYVEEKGKDFFALVVEQGLEGVIGKGMDSLYQPGKRSRDWVKVKNVQEEDYVICGYELSAHVAMLILGQYDDEGRMRYKGRATLGLRTEDFALIRETPHIQSWPFPVAPPGGGDGIQWIAPRWVCSVAFLRRTQDGLMRQPHYRGLRPDIAPEEAREAKAKPDPEHP